MKKESNNFTNLDKRFPKPVPSKTGMELGPNDCRYVLGDPGRGGIGTRFCGHPCKHGSSYCEEHHHLCYEGKSKNLVLKDSSENSY